MKHLLSLLLFLAFTTINLFAQPSNDECSTLIDLGEAPVCPPPGVYTNLDATESIIGPINEPSCFNGGGTQNDVWFAFTVPANGSVTDFEITVTGTTGGLVMPQVAVYRGDCTELQELFCASAPINEIEVELQATGLTPSVQYFVRINDYSASATPNWGEFELCIAEYVPDVNIGEEEGSSFCFGTLYDSGGPDEDYGNNESFVYTICPDDFTQCITINIEDYDIEPGFDFLNVYAGNSTAGIGVLALSGAGSDVEVFVPDGCATIEFTSDGFTVGSGFQLSWSCSPDVCNIPPFSTCDNPDVVPNLPYSAADLTTCTAGNSVGEGPCDNANYMNGNEYLFTYESAGDECISVSVTGSSTGTGISIFNDCPDVATECISQTGDNNIADPMINFAYLENPGTYYIAVANDLGCTPFDISIDSIECPNIFPSAALCEDALGLNGCTPNIPAIVSVAPGEGDPDFINDLNRGCIGFPQLNYTFFYFQAGADGNFGFTMESADPNETSDIDFNVWGPIPDFETACDWMLVNQPVRSSFAGGADPTGLADIHPVLGTPVTDEWDCDGDNDDFVTTLPVEAGEYYFVWIDDFGQAIVSGAISIDFSQTTPGVLDGTNTDQFTVSADTAVCSGAIVQLEATGGELYEWTPSTGLSCTDCPNPIATPTTSTQYQVTIFGICDSYSQFVNVDIFETGTLEDVDVCIGEVNQIDVGPIDPTITYTWTPGTDLSCTDCPNPFITASTAGSTEYILEIVAPGCTVRDTFIWNVVNSLAPEYTISDDKEICLGENTNLGGPFQPDVTYSWTSDPPGFMNATPNPNVTPTQSTTYYLEVVNTACPFTSFDSVFVDVFIPPVVELANDTTLCLGNGMEMGDSPNNQAGVVYTWTPDTYLVDPTDPNTEILPTDPGTFTYTLEAVRGACTITESITISVTEIALELTNPDTVLLCQGESANLNAVSLPAGVDVTWSPGTYLNTTVGNDVVSTPIEEIMYTATISVPGCTYTDSVVILVDSLPEDLAIMPLDTMVCQGSIVQLVTTTYEQFEFPDIEFEWSPDSGFESPDSLLNMVIEANVDQTYTRVTTNGGCTSIDTARVTILPVTVIEVVPEPIICLGESVVLDSNADTEMLEDIEWMPETGLSCTDCSDPTANPSATTTYMIMGTQPNGCPAMGTVTVEVWTEPLIIFPDVEQCVGDMVSLNLAPAEQETTYSWTSPTDPNFSSSEPSPVVTMVDDITYIVTADNGVCPPVTDDIILDVIQEPTFTASPDITICAGDVITLSAEGSENGSYSWSNGQSGSSIEVSPGASTTYVVDYVWGPNCGTISEEINVIVEPSVTVVIEADPPLGTIAQGVEVIFTAITSPDSIDVTYSWSLNGNDLDATSMILMQQPFENPSTYTVVVTTPNGCTNEFSYTLNVTPPLWDIPSAFTPDGDNINDVFKLLYDGEINMESFQIFNRWGQKVFETNDPDMGWDGRHKGSMAPSDVYVYLIKLNPLSGQVILKGDVTLIR